MNLTPRWKFVAPAVLIAWSLSACVGSSTETKPTNTPVSLSSVSTSVPSSDTSGTGGLGLDTRGRVLADQVALDLTKTEDPPITNAQAQCWANGIVARLGYDRVKELGLDSATGTALKDLTGSEVSNVEAHDIISAMFGCWDVRVMLVQSAQTPDERLVTECVVPQLSNHELQDFMVAETFGIDPSPDMATVLQKASAKCSTGSGTEIGSSGTVALAGAGLSDDEFVGAVAQAAVDAGLAPDITVGRCWADGMNSEFGVARLRELNLADPAIYNSGKPMKPDEAAKAVTSLSSCIDLKKIIVGHATTPEARQIAQCEVEKLNDDEVKQLVAATLSGVLPRPELTTKFEDTLKLCEGN